MVTTRQQKISRLLEKELGEIFLLYAKKMHGVLITVTEVKISPDLGIAHTYISVFPKDKKEETIKGVETDKKTVRYELGKRVKNQLRLIPELHFHLDESLDYLENIDSLLKSDPIIHSSDEDYGMDKYEKK
ncbi:MAG: 30S ribosome-binding factor RbfA [Paludibacteraceae bacterium]